MNNPFTIIKDDHKKVAGLFDQYAKLEDGQQEEKEKLGKVIMEELRHHAKMEEKFLYPELEKAFDDQEDEYVEEAKAEHTSMKLVMAQLAVLPPSSPKFDANMTVLREQVEHHVEEEENTIIPLAEENFTEEQKDSMAQHMLAFKDNVKKGLIDKLEDKIEDFFG